MHNKQIYILIGPKGSGKSFIGTIFKKYFNIDFIRVEDWILKVKNVRDIDDKEYMRDAFQTVEKGLREALIKSDYLVFESTGLTEHFDKLLDNLKTHYKVITIKINAELTICLTRIKTRDQSIHISVSDEQVERINALVISKNIRTDYIIDNNDKSVEDLKNEIKQILKSTAPNSVYN